MARLLGDGRYVLGSELGTGGMGTVYDADDLVTTERVAIKIAHDDGVAGELVAEHMARELRVGREIQHANVVRMLDGGNDAGRPFLVMERATGRTLSTLLGDAHLSIGRVAEIVDQILDGLGAIHRAGYLHGDIKSDNVIVDRTGDGRDVVKLIDLGLACEQLEIRTGADDEVMISGTPQYLAPEIAMGGVKTVASELYAVGVILYELLTGTTPFGDGPIFEVLRRQVQDAVMLPSIRKPELRIPLSLERVVMHALRKDPSERFTSASEFQAALRAASRESRDIMLVAHEVTTSISTARWTRPQLPGRVLAVGTAPIELVDPVDPKAIVAAALDETRAHVTAHRLSAARQELEGALRLLEGDDEGESFAWQLLLPLAAVCDALRDPLRARRVARLALDCAARAGSEEGRRRAKDLIERFAGRTAAHA